MHERSTNRLRMTVVAIGLVAGMMGTLAGAALAAHQFSDVPTNHFFHGNINALVDSGCATGYNDGTYKPAQNVTRGQVAQQLTQCGTRVAMDTEPTIIDPADGVNGTVGNVALTAGGSNPNTGSVLVMGQANMIGDEIADCPCRLTVDVRNVNTNTIAGTVRTMISADDCFAGSTCGTVHTQHVFPAGNSTAGNTFEARARISTAGDNTGYQVTGSVIAMYVPFDGNPLD